MLEKEIIQQYFLQPPLNPKRCRLGIGDDAALLDIPEGHSVVSSIDTLLEAVHFAKAANPYDIGYKSLAVSLSDMAAMGAEPIAALLSLSLPKVDLVWLDEFSQGFFDLAREHRVDLMGGDLVSGPLAVTTVMQGVVPYGQAVCRSGAQVGDDIFVTGHLGDAGYALLCDQAPASCALQLNRPPPRIQAGLKLRQLASSAIDISDGLLLDITRLAERSEVGAVIYADQLPVSKTLQALPSRESWDLALTAGDDYEIAFTVSKQNSKRLDEFDFGVEVTKIGEIIANNKIEVRDENNQIILFDSQGYQHFT